MHLQKNQLLPKFNEAKQKFKSNSHPILFRYTQEINFKCSFPSLLDLEIDQLSGKSFWSRPSLKTSIFSLGETLSMNLDKNNKSTLNLNIEKTIENLVSVNHTNQNQIPIFIGGQNFNISQKNLNIWKEVNVADFRVPELLLYKQNDFITVTFFTLIDNDTSLESIYNEFSHYYSTIEKFQSEVRPGNIKLGSKKNRIDKSSFLETISDIKNIIEHQDIRKIVLSNITEYKFTGDISFPSLIYSLEKKYPECAIFYFNYNGVFIGASPENILSTKKNILSIDALAGSVKRNNNSKKDAEIQNYLYENKKMIDEHEIVVTGILEDLRKIDIDAKTSKREILSLKNVHHLKTDIMAYKQNQNTLDILDQIAPTPALSGYPKSKAIEMIESIESYDRGWYSGVVGWIGKDLDADFYAGLRSAYIKDNYIYIYAGAGVTIDSIPEDEWSEILNKMSAIDEIINE